MLDNHILDGDYGLIEKTIRTRTGEIVVAFVDGAETTLKKFFLQATMMRSQPANKVMDPIIVPAWQVEARGGCSLFTADTSEGTRAGHHVSYQSHLRKGMRSRRKRGSRAIGSGERCATNCTILVSLGRI